MMDTAGFTPARSFGAPAVEHILTRRPRAWEQSAREPQHVVGAMVACGGSSTS